MRGERLILCTLMSTKHATGFGDRYAEAFEEGGYEDMDDLKTGVCAPAPPTHTYTHACTPRAQPPTHTYMYARTRRAPCTCVSTVFTTPPAMPSEEELKELLPTAKRPQLVRIHADPPSPYVTYVTCIHINTAVVWSHGHEPHAIHTRTRSQYRSEYTARYVSSLAQQPVKPTRFKQPQTSAGI